MKFQIHPDVRKPRKGRSIIGLFFGSSSGLYGIIGFALLLPAGIMARRKKDKPVGEILQPNILLCLNWNLLVIRNGLFVK